MCRLSKAQPQPYIMIKGSDSNEDKYSDAMCINC